MSLMFESLSPGSTSFRRCSISAWMPCNCASFHSATFFRKSPGFSRVGGVELEFLGDGIEEAATLLHRLGELVGILGQQISEAGHEPVECLELGGVQRVAGQPFLLVG